VRHGLPTDRGFTLAFGVCACALVVGVMCALMIPRAHPARARDRRRRLATGRAPSQVHG